MTDKNFHFSHFHYDTQLLSPNKLKSLQTNFIKGQQQDISVNPHENNKNYKTNFLKINKHKTI